MAKVIPIHESPEAEQAVLGAVLVRPEVLGRVADLIEPSDFYRGAHGRIFWAMCQLHGRSEPVDLVTVTGLLKEQGLLEGVGGPLFLVSLSEAVGFATNAEYYARRVREKSQRRRVEAAAQRIIGQCREPNDVVDLLQYAESSIFEVTGEHVSLDDPIIPAAVLLSKDFSRSEDCIANGILPQGGAMILAGESGEGKSLIRLELAIHLAQGWDLWNLDIPRPRKVLIIQFENTEQIEAYRLRKMLSGLNIDCPGNLMFSTPTTRFDLGEPKDQSRLVRMVEQGRAEVVIYDPLSSLHGVNENDNALMRRILDNLTEVNRRTGAAAIVVHHFGKPASGDTTTAHRTRGASSIKDWCDSLAAFSRRKSDEQILRALEFIKVRNGPEPKAMILERSKDTFLHTLTDAEDICPPERVRDILQGLGGRVEGQVKLRKAIIEETKCGERRARHFIQQAVTRGAISCDSDPLDSRKRVYSMVNCSFK